MSFRSNAILFSLFVVALLVPAVEAGTISVAWDAANDPDVDGYRVYYGTSPGSYSRSTDVGTDTQVTLQGLDDCRRWYVAVKSYDAAGNESALYSNEISGWPRPVVSSADPSSGPQGGSLSVTVTGTNFESGASVTFGNPGITVDSVNVVSCTQIVADISIAASATLGAGDIDVTNPDLAYGARAGAFTVLSAPAPTVGSTSPADGATDVGIDVKPSISFSEPMMASSITTSTVRLLDGSGNPVPQAAGSPALSADGATATITPTGALANDGTYKIRAVGGASGVLSALGIPMATTYTQTNGFTTQSDNGAPEITSVRSDQIEPTRVMIRWETSEDADGQVFYRKVGTSAYQSTTIDATLTTSHAIALEGLTPAQGYEYHVRSADAAGNGATSSPDETFTTTGNGFRYIRVETEAGILESPFSSGDGAGTFGGRYLDAGAGSGGPDNPSGTALYGFNLPSAGTWHLWVRLQAPDSSSSAWFESMDGAQRQTIAPSGTGAWEWVGGRSYDLSAGLHSLELGGQDPDARADRILLTDDPTFVPTEQAVGDVIPPAEVTTFTATGSDKKVVLSFSHPGDADFVKTVVRFRSDGRYPTSPDDGSEVVTIEGEPGDPAGYVHTDLVNGTTYRYAAFTVDATGNVSPGSRIEAVPTDDVPPPAVENLRRIDLLN